MNRKIIVPAQKAKRKKYYPFLDPKFKAGDRNRILNIVMPNTQKGAPNEK